MLMMAAWHAVTAVPDTIAMGHEERSPVSIFGFISLFICFVNFYILWRESHVIFVCSHPMGGSVGEDPSQPECRPHRTGKNFPRLQLKVANIRVDKI